ncbi:hypothetical protein [uncultured Anaerococcus sp.]|nr:hypothetical protein [uncultured Anaerococcus sp.]
MGSFGHHLCRSLAENECEIMVVDKDSSRSSNKASSTLS